MPDTGVQILAFEIRAGIPLPLGAHERGGGVNIAVFSRHATRVSLLLFGEATTAAPYRSIELDPERHRTGDVWHVWVKGVGHGTMYAWRAEGPYHPEQGHRFNPHKILLDPYAKALTGTDCWDFACACGDDPDSPADDLFRSTRDDTPWKAKSLVSDGRFDWRGDHPLRHSWADTVIYETHVRSLTVHPSSAVRHPGTFLGLIKKIPYFQELGITAIELMPVQEFHENELVRSNPVTGERLRNYWGYSTAAFFAPKESYSTRSHLGSQLVEFKTMVRELHRAGIEVILDIVFNHTTGPWRCTGTASGSILRRFWRGDPGLVGALASRIAGSADIYQVGGKQPVNSINFITSHDGFTLNDLVSYRHKHNEANGENNVDGASENYSEHHGVEGETDDPAIEAAQVRQIRNFVATRMISRGVPMLLGGDEFRRTQHGNNNAYCQDHEGSWHDWTLLERHREIFLFGRGMIELRRRHKMLRMENFYTDRDILWFDERGAEPRWDGPGHTIGCRIRPPEEGGAALCLLFNAGGRDEEFLLPSTEDEGWRVVAETAQAAPFGERTAGGAAEPLLQDRYRLQNRSMAILTSG